MINVLVFADDLTGAGASSALLKKQQLAATVEVDILDAEDRISKSFMHNPNAGPIPADSVFYLARRGEFDAVLSLYHDQGHIAAKMVDFEKTVSVTLGLPFLRTSVDHGTAFE